MTLRALPGGRSEADPEGRVPPHDLDAEAAVLSAAMLDPVALGRLGGFLRPEHFYSESHRRIYEASLAVRASGTALDVVTVGAWLKDRDRLQQVGGMGYLTEVLAAAPKVANIVDYAAVVYEKWRARQLIVICQLSASTGYLDYGETQDFLDRTVRQLAEIARAGMGVPVENNAATLRRLVHAMVQGDPSGAHEKVTGLRTGIAALDSLTNGLHATDKTTVAALNGRGKTTLALQIASNVACQGIGVLFFELDQPREQMMLKLLSMHARVDHRRLRGAVARTVELSPAEIDRIYEVQAKVEALPIWFHDDPDVHIGQVRQIALAHAERLLLVEKMPLGLVVLDYVQKLAPAPEVAHAKTHERIAHATKGFKRLCQEMKLPGIELAQQKPSEIDPKTKKRPRPATGCIADSSQIEKEADVILYLHREPLIGPGGRANGEDSTKVSIIVDKQRGGSPGEILTTFEGEFSTFVGPEPEEREGLIP